MTIEQLKEKFKKILSLSEDDKEDLRLFIKEYEKDNLDKYIEKQSQKNIK